MRLITGGCVGVLWGVGVVGGGGSPQHSPIYKITCLVDSFTEIIFTVRFTPASGYPFRKPPAKNSGFARTAWRFTSTEKLTLVS